MKITHYTAQEMAPILGIGERAVTQRIKSIRVRALQLNKKVLDGETSQERADVIISELIKKKFGDYNYVTKWTGDRPKYWFYKNKTE